MKLLGIDFGKKRVGVAISDEEGKFAFPHIVLDNDGDIITNIALIVCEHKVDKIIIGESRNFKMEKNPIMQDIERFIDEWQAASKVPIELHPEYMSSQQAQRIDTDKEGIDAKAAAIILQSYIDHFTG